MKRYTVVANPEGRNFPTIRQAIQTLNGLQNYFHCQLAEDTEILASEETQTSAQKLAKKLGEKLGTDSIIAVTEEYYDPNMVVIENYLPDLILITCAEWDTKNPPTPRLFLVYALASSLITLEAKLTARLNKKMAHDPPVGCIFDWWDDERMLSVGMVSARICLDCQRKLRESGVPSKALLAIHKVLEYVRRAIIGEETPLATKIFIAHGHSDDWLELKRMLEEFGLEVAEFNSVNPTGYLIADRWKEMLDQSRFAFAILSPDDRLPDERYIPRLNVVHEIGLCHARLGVESTAILREKTVNVFTNIEGINTIEYRAGSLKEKRREIEQLLKERGVLNPEFSDASFVKSIFSLLPEPERKHLLNLEDGKAKQYKGQGSLRTELRHLRSLGLLRSLEGKIIGGLRTGETHNLEHYVELTEAGKRVVEHLRA